MAFNPNASQLSEEQIIQQVFDPVNNALRTDATVQVDTINANLTVDIKASDGDNIAIVNQDGSNPLHINADGSINVNTISNSSDLINTYNEVTSIASGNLTTIVSRTMPSSGKLDSIEVSGSNIATYTVELNSTIIAKARTYFGGDLNHFFDFKSGIVLNSGDVIRTRVIHNRPSLGDFNARLETTT